MRILVIGAGLTGVTSAWYLREAGLEVLVIDRQPEAARETSFANGGQISAGHPEPWANPGAPATVLRWLGREDAPLKFRLRADPAQWRWGFAFLRECLPARTRRNTEAIARLALYSREQLKALRQRTGISYDCLARGILQLSFDARELAALAPRAELLHGLGMRAEVLDAAGCVAVEPALAHTREPLQGGLYAVDDESGDAYRFTQALASLCAERGVEFLYGTRVTRWDFVNGRLFGLQIVDASGRRGSLRGDAILVCAGAHSAAFARLLGERLPIYPVKGYSITAPVLDRTRAPEVSITDESRRIVCSRLGDRLRAAGTAELTGYDLTVNPARAKAVLDRTLQLFPGSVDPGRAELWAGLRPATPGNVPIIGRSRRGNVYYNTGHGTLGWTLACGSGRAIADLISGRAPGIDFPFRGIGALKGA